jgi:type IV pilus assembly protein PilO
MNLPKINFRDPRLRTIALIMLVGLAGVYGWYDRVYTGRSTQVAEQKVKVKEKQKRLNEILAMKPQRNRLRQEIMEKKAILDSLKSIFPDQKEIPKLIQEITRQARVANVYPTKFNPNHDVEKEYYVENRYNMSIWSSYHDFATFLARLANLRLIINLSNVKIASHPQLMQQLKDSTETRPYTITADFMMTTFSSKR